MLKRGLIVVALVFGGQGFAQGQASFANGLQVPQVDGVANVPNPLEGELYYDFSNNTFYGFDGMSWLNFGSGGVTGNTSTTPKYLSSTGDGTNPGAVTWSVIPNATSDAEGLVTSFTPIAKSSVNTVSSADYLILDNDGYDTILVSTGSSNRTVTLPTAVDNTGRRLLIKKTDTGSGTIVVDGEGSETIEGSSTITVGGQYGYLQLVGSGSGWVIEGLYDSGEFTGTINSTSKTWLFYRTANSTCTIRTPTVTGVGNVAALQSSTSIAPSRVVPVLNVYFPVPVRIGTVNGGSNGTPGQWLFRSTNQFDLSATWANSTITFGSTGGTNGAMDEALATYPCVGG